MSYYKNHDHLINKIKNTGVSKTIVDAMDNLDRKDFLTKNKELAYLDRAVDIGWNVTISQPTLVAKMIEYLNLDSINVVLELGTGSAYNAAIISQIVEYGHLTTVERIRDLYFRAQELLEDHYNVRVIYGDATKLTLPHKFDRIIITAEFKNRSVVDTLIRNNAATFCICVFPYNGALIRLTKVFDDILEEELIPVRFVPVISGTLR